LSIANVPRSHGWYPGLVAETGEAFLSLCRARGVHPLRARAVPAWAPGDGRAAVDFRLPLEDLRAMAEATGEFGGVIRTATDADGDGRPLRTWVEVGRRRGFGAAESRCRGVAEVGDNFLGQLPATASRERLRRSAEADAIRRGFPAETQGILTPDDPAFVPIVDHRPEPLPAA
jgi:hypothetical protein